MKLKPLTIKYCDRCNIDLPPGSTKYTLRLEITSEWDGYLPDTDDRKENELSEILEKATKLDEKTLEDQVHMELTLTLCPSCREQFLEDLDLVTDGKPVRKGKPPAHLH